MNYDSRASVNFVTTWSKIKLSWLVVSTNFYSSSNPLDPNARGNLVWAGTYGLSDPTTQADQPLIVNSIFANQPAIYDAADDVCGYVNSSPPGFDLNCGPAYLNTRFVVHTYVTGFRFNPNVAGGLHAIAASILLGAGSGSANLRDISEAYARGAGGQDFVFFPVPTANTPSGPKFSIRNFANQLTYLKYSVVITTIPDMSQYPTVTNDAPFVYSGVYMGYFLFNNDKALAQNTFSGNAYLQPNGLNTINTGNIGGG